MKNVLCVITIWLFVMAFVSDEREADRHLLFLSMPVAVAAEGQTASSEKPAQPSAVTRGMKKDHVQALWGDPVEVRQIRTCFGTREEWVYRGDAQRHGREERTLLFDEDEVLEEIK